MKKAYLTIDDAPSCDFMSKVEFLSQHGIPALFFCEGRFIEQYKDNLCTAINRGFVIGNHSYSHPYFSDLSFEECKREILTTEELIEYVYKLSGNKRPAKYFRFPYFDTGGDISGKVFEEKWNLPSSEWFSFEQDDKRMKIQQFLLDNGFHQPAFKGINTEYFRDPSLLTAIDVRCTYDQGEYWLNKADAPFGLSKVEMILARIDEDDPYNGRSLNREDTSDIILIHDHSYTTPLFYRILTRYIEKGILFLQIP